MGTIKCILLVMILLMQLTARAKESIRSLILESITGADTKSSLQVSSKSHERALYYEPSIDSKLHSLNLFKRVHPLVPSDQIRISHERGRLHLDLRVEGVLLEFQNDDDHKLLSITLLPPERERKAKEKKE